MSDSPTPESLQPDWLTAQWLADVFDADVASVSATRIGDGLVGMNLRLTVVADPVVPSSLVVKLPSPDPLSRATGVAMRNYEREVCFYRDLAATVDIRVPVCHHVERNDDSGDFVLLLEDLAPAAQGNQLTGCSVDQARTAVVELARLHGPRWDDPTLAQFEWLSRRTDADDTARLIEYWQIFMPGFLGTYAQYLSAEALDVLERFGPLVGDWVDGREGPYTVTHGDYRLDNLMFATPAGGAAIAAVDWQTPGHGPGVSDVSYFLGAGLLPQERRLVERSLLGEYAEGLDAYGVHVDDDLLWRHYRRETFAGVIMTVMASQVVGPSERSEALFAAMGTRHLQHAIDLDAIAVVRAS